MFLSLLIHLNRILGILTAKSQVNVCRRVHDPDNLSLHSCKTKLLLNLAVDQESNIDRFVIDYLKSEGSEGDSFSTGVKLQLENPLILSIKKSEVRAKYGMKYIATVNGRPYEQIAFGSQDRCEKGEKYAEGTDCGGLVSTEDKRKMKRTNQETQIKENFPQSTTQDDSTGFCCACDLDQMFKIKGKNRNPKQCHPFSPFKSDSASVHCVRFDPARWWKLYELLPPVLDFQIEVFLQRGYKKTDENVESLSLTAKVSPTAPIAVVESDPVFGVIRFVGDFALTRSLKQFESYYLAEPPAAVKSVGLKVSQLLHKSMFDLSGRTCDKIGVSFSGFKNQNNPCSARVGNCLHNQLDEIHNTNNSIEQLLCDQPKNFFLDGHSAGCIIRDRSTSEVLLELDEIEILVLVGDTKCRLVSVTAQNNVQSPSIEALTETISVNVLLESLEEFLSGTFYLEVTDCDLKMTTGAVVISLDPKQSKETVLTIVAKSAAEKTYNCRLAVHGASEGDLADEKWFKVTLHATVENLVQMGNLEESENFKIQKSSYSNNNICQTLCIWWNLICLLKNRCIWDFLKILGCLTAVSFIAWLIARRFIARR
jgi:Male gamete fusion factor